MPFICLRSEFVLPVYQGGAVSTLLPGIFDDISIAELPVPTHSLRTEFSFAGKFGHVMMAAIEDMRDLIRVEDIFVEFGGVSVLLKRLCTGFGEV